MNSSLKILELMDSLNGCLHPDALNSIKKFITAKFDDKVGAFVNRFEKTDLYYTSFGLACADALNVKLPVDKVKSYLKVQTPENLDLIHLSCYIRSALLVRKLRLPKYVSQTAVPRFLFKVKETALLEKFCIDYGYCIDHGKPVNPYAIFLAVTALENGGSKVVNPAKIVEKVNEFRVGLTGWSNFVESKEATLNATTAAMVAIADCGGEVDNFAFLWLWQQYDKNKGGFYATPDAPIPDLLSTASALLTLHIYGVDIPKEVRKKCYLFVMAHWCDDGGFCGTVVDDDSDCEYTFYGLLALGILSS